MIFSSYASPTKKRFSLLWSVWSPPDKQSIPATPPPPNIRRQITKFNLLEYEWIYRSWRCVPTPLPAPRLSDVLLSTLRVSDSHVRTSRSKIKHEHLAEKSRIIPEITNTWPSRLLATAHGLFACSTSLPAPSSQCCCIHLVKLPRTRSTKHWHAAAININSSTTYRIWTTTLM